MFLCVVTKLREAIQNPPRVSVTRHFSSKVYRPFPSFRRLQHKYGLYVQFFFCYVNFTFSHFSPLILPLTTLRYRFCCSWLCGLFYFSVRLCLIFKFCRSRWPRGLGRRSVAARFLGLRVRIPRDHGCLSPVTVVYCQVEVSATSWSLVQRSPTDCAASLCVI